MLDDPVPMADDGEALTVDDDDSGEYVSLETIKAWYREDFDHWREWRKQAEEDFAFVAGDQWSEDDKARLNEQLRPVITFNRIAPVVDAVSGAEVSNRQEVRYIPREQGDVGVNELLTGAAEWFRDECDAEDEESDAFLDCVIAGVGWTETRLDYEQEEDGKPLIERVDPFEMLADAAARKRNLGDARRVWRVRDIELGEAKAMFPDHDEEDFNASWAGEIGPDQPIDREEARRYEGDSGSGLEDNDKVRIVELQYWEKEVAGHRVFDPATRKSANFSPDEYGTLTDRMKQFGITVESRKTMRRVYKRCFVGNVILEQEKAPSQTGFNYKAITAKRDRNAGTFYGLVRQMKDPQRWANKWLSQLLHIVNSNSKGGVMAETTAVTNVRQFEESWADQNAVTWLKDGAIAKGQVKEKPAAQFPAGFFQMTEFAVSSIRDVTGVSLEIMGMREADQAASLEYQRRQAGVTILASLFDSLRRYRKEQGRLLLDYIQRFLSDGRLIRISGQQGKQYVPLVRQEGVSTYDIIVDDAPSSPNQKEQVWGILMQMLPILKDTITPAILLEFMKYSPLPESVVQKVTEIAQQPNPQAEKAQQIGEAQATADIQKTLADAELAKAKAQGEAQKLPLEQAKIQGVQVKSQAEVLKARVGIEKSQAELQLAQQQGALKAQQMAQQNQMAQQKHAMGLQQSQDQHLMGMQQSSESHALKQEQMAKQAQQPSNGGQRK